MRYLYDRPEASFKDLLLAGMRAKVESRDHNITRAKAVTATELNKDTENTGGELHDLTEQLKSLGQYLKSSTYTTKSKFLKGNRDPQNQSQGPSPSAARPFQDRPPVQCYKCSGWGHYQQQCPNREKVAVTAERENIHGEETWEDGSTHRGGDEPTTQ